MSPTSGYFTRKLRQKPPRRRPASRSPSASRLTSALAASSARAASAGSAHSSISPYEAVGRYTRPLVDREDPQAVALLVGQVVAAERVDVEARQREVSIVDQHVLDAGLAQHTRQVRLPDALGEPHPARTDSEVRLEERREPLDLTDLVEVRQHGQDRLVESTGQELHLSARGEGPEEVEGTGRVLAQPLEQAAGIVDAQPDLRALVEPLEERPIGALGRLDHHVVEVADRLVVVDAETERQAIHRSRGSHSRSRSRWTTVGAYPRPARNRPSSSASVTERDRKSTRLNSSHLVISYAVFCLKKKKILQLLSFSIITKKKD